MLFRSEYLETAVRLLKKDGKLYLKLDIVHMKVKFRKENIVKEEQVLTYFKITSSQIVDNEFIFYVLIKK